MTDDAVLIQARERFKRAAEAEDRQRKIVLECKKFRAGEQWPDEIKIQRQGGAAIAGQAAQPPRPMLTIDRISQPTRQVSNAVKQANFAINVQPNGYGADDETAQIYKGLLRWIQNRARSEGPIDWAADQAAEGGIGWFRLYAEYAEHEITPNSHPKDQDLCIGRIANNLSVYCDPSAVKPTRSDAKWMFVTENVSKDDFKRRWPKASMTHLDEFRAAGDQDDWITDDGYRVAEYWDVTFDETTLVELESGEVLDKKLVPEGAALTDWSRKMFTPKVTCRKITATEILDEWTWLGTRIPLFPIIGEELNIDGLARYRGVIEPAMDPQRMVNYHYSGAVEISALGSKSPWIVAEGQVERYKDIWQNANRFNYSYLPYTPQSLLGSPIGPPMRDTAEPPIQAMVMLLEKSEEAIKATTGIYDPSLGRTTSSNESGVKAKALIKQSEMSNSNYIDNVLLTMTEAGNELVYLLPKYYDRVGRVVQILGIDDQPKQVMLGQPYQETPQGVQAAPDVPPEMAKLSKGLHKFYDLGQGRYSVSVNVGKSTTTKREEGSMMMGEMIGQNPALLQIIGDLFFRDLDAPWAQEASDRMKKMLAPQVQQSQGGEPNPAELQAKMAQASQMIDVLSKELDAKTKIIETDAVKAQQQVAIAQAKEQAETQRQQQQQQADFELAKMKIVADLLKTKATIDAADANRQIDRATAELDSRIAQEDAHVDRVHEAYQADLDRGHEAEQAEQQRGQDAEQSDAQRQHEADLASQAVEAQNSEPA